jgi:hypothetical protein
VTVLFADVANYTSMSEKLDPEEVHQIVDGCFKILMDEIHKYEGTITQFTGDGAMALFGAPIAHEDHAQRACRAALDIQRAMEGYGEKIGKDYGLDFRLRMGLNSGPGVQGSDSSGGVYLPGGPMHPFWGCHGLPAHSGHCEVPSNSPLNRSNISKILSPSFPTFFLKTLFPSPSTIPQ